MEEIVHVLWVFQIRVCKILSLTLVLSCQVSCGQIVLKRLTLNMPPAGVAL